MTALTAPPKAVRAAKPDLRTWILVVLCFCAATAMLSSDLAFILLTAWALTLYALLGEARRIPLLAGVYALLFGLRALILAAGDVPVIPYFGVTVILVMRAYPVYLLILLAFLRLPMNEIMATLERLRVPSTALIVLMVTYRYIPTLLGEMRTIATAWSLRSRTPAWRRWLVPHRQTEGYIVPIIMRSGRIADELSRVAVCKGFEPNHPRTHIVHPRIQTADVAALTTTVFVCAALIFAERTGMVTAL